MRIVFLGTGEIGVPAFKALADSKKHEVIGVMTQPDRPVGRHQELHAPQVKQEAVARGIQVSQPEKINTPEALDLIRGWKPELIVVCAYGQILKKDLLKIPARGCVNIHASLLPKHRGAACIAAAIREGDEKSGITMMQMDEGLDTGDILLQEALEIRNEDTAGSLHDRLAELAAPVLLRTLDLLEQGKLVPKKQDSASASYATKLKKEDGLIRWEKTAREIDRHIRAMIPWPSAYTYLNQKMLKIFSAKMQPRVKGKAGEIMSVDGNGICVAAGEGGLLLTEIQLEGKKRMSVGEFLRGHQLRVGEFFC